MIERRPGRIKVRYRWLVKKTAHCTPAICAVQPVDGAQILDGSAAMSALANSQSLESWPAQLACTDRQAIAQGTESASLIDSNS